MTEGSSPAPQKTAILQPGKYRAQLTLKAKKPTGTPNFAQLNLTQDKNFKNPYNQIFYECTPKPYEDFEHYYWGNDWAPQLCNEALSQFPTDYFGFATLKEKSKKGNMTHYRGTEWVIAIGFSNAVLINVYSYDQHFLNNSQYASVEPRKLPKGNYQTHVGYFNNVPRL